MRRLIAALIAGALFVAGAFLLYSFGLEAGRMTYLGPFLMLAGALIVASDWFGL